jgi:plastocyanin
MSNYKSDATMNEYRFLAQSFFGILPLGILGLLVSCSVSPPPAKSATVIFSSSSSSSSSSSQFANSSFANSSSVVVALKSQLRSSASISAKQHSSISSAQIQKERNQLEAKAVDTGKVAMSGSVVVLDKNGEKLSSEGVIINLEPIALDHIGSDHKNATNLQPVQHRIDMRNKTYLPGLLAVKKNDLVSFVNKDNIKHNTFSSSGENTFDLGTYGPGITQSAKLIAPGIVKVYCNIHPEMASFISVSEHNYSYITQADGKFVINDLPKGRYSLTAWNIRGETRLQIDLEKSLYAYEIKIDTAGFVAVPHKNKYGETYKVKPALFNDEFY